MNVADAVNINKLLRYVLGGTDTITEKDVREAAVSLADSAYAAVTAGYTGERVLEVWSARPPAPACTCPPNPINDRENCPTCANEFMRAYCLPDGYQGTRDRAELALLDNALADVQADQPTGALVGTPAPALRLAKVIDQRDAVSEMLRGMAL